MDVCRICLSKKTDKDIFQEQINKNDDKTACTDIMMFCLDIKVEQESKISSKLCLKCYRKLTSFYNFKSLALKNDAYLKTLDIKNEIFIREDEVKIKLEESSVIDDSSAISLVKEEPSDEICEAVEPTDCNFESDDEFLSAIKKIKYEYVVENTESTKENDVFPVEAKAKKRKRSKADVSTEPGVKQMCEECGKTVTDLKSHSYLHLPVAQRKRIKCHVCDKMFSSHSARYKHNRIKHLGVKQKCNICNKVVTHLKQHKRTMHERESLRHECPQCARRFVCRSLLDQHTRSHTRDKPFACPNCDKKFATNNLLQMHIRAVHHKEKSHLCQLCSKSFFKKYHLQKHLISHSKEKPFECPDCGKFYKTEATLKSHRETHGDSRNFACQLCLQTFMKREYLVVHMITHTKEKRYPCQYCGVKFHRSDHRKRHEYTAHQKHLLASST